jgi:hypothetical protein
MVSGAAGTVSGTESENRPVMSQTDYSLCQAGDSLDLDYGMSKSREEVVLDLSTNGLF